MDELSLPKDDEPIVTENDVLREALVLACRQLLISQKYGTPLSKEAPAPLLNDDEIEEASNLYGYFIDCAALYRDYRKAAERANEQL